MRKYRVNLDYDGQGECVQASLTAFDEHGDQVGMIVNATHGGDAQQLVNALIAEAQSLFCFQTVLW